MNSDQQPPDAGSGHPTPAGDPQGPLIIRSEDLLQGRREVWIEHLNEMYRLRATANGKLYLTK